MSKDVADEVPLVKLSLHLDPESIEILRDLGQRLQAMENELKLIRESFSQVVHKFFEIKELPPGLGEAVVSELNPGAAPAGD